MTGTLHPGELGTILGVWAHPDDEAYLMAGTALLAAAAGSTVACVTATVGEAGESADEDRWPREQLGTIRREELAASLEILGIDDHTLLGFPDGGLARIDRATGVARIGEVVARVQPETILTFGPDGMTGHSDHITVADWAVEAAAERGSRCRVLAATKTPDWLETFAHVNDGILASTPPRTPAADLAVDVTIDDKVVDLKMRALRAQASQTSSLIAALGESTYRAWVASEFWVARHP